MAGERCRSAFATLSNKLRFDTAGARAIVPRHFFGWFA